ncbi:MAG: hypothetical protein M3069_33435 [Chloroflexota bacterium]|nr:hypothetical protein [Chloroflexota bacterium]
MQDAFSKPNAERSVMELIVDQLEELIVTIVEDIRQRPGVAAAILAAVVGVIVGSVLAATLGRKRPSAPARVVRKARGATEAADLAGLGLKLLQNPLVRGFVLSAVQRQMKKRFSI